jgi:hypothetical protein
MKSRLFPVFALAWLMASGPVLAVRAGNNVRYALVVGNNHGHNPAAPLVDLKHAESEAWRLRDRLIKYGNFDPDRVVLLTSWVPCPPCSPSSLPATDWPASC